nr:LON peptidase substrate-binding domain-containing protein [Leptospira ryugenii]
MVSTFSLPIFPLSEVFLFPGTFLPLHIFEPRYRSMLSYCLENGRELAVSPYRQSDQWNIEMETTFGFGHIIQHEALPDGRSNIILEGLGIASLQEIISEEPFIIANVEKMIPERNLKEDENYQQTLDELIFLSKRILLREGADESLILKMNQIKNHFYPVDFLASIIPFDYESKQKILSTTKSWEKSLLFLEVLINLNLSE